MSTSIDGVPARTPGSASLRKAILAGVSCLLVFGSGAGAKNGHRGDAADTERAAATAQPAPKVYRGAEVLGVFPARRISVDMSTLARPQAWRPGDPIKEIPKRSKVRPGKSNPDAQAAARAQTAGADPLRAVQEQAKGGRTSRAFSTPTLNFAGQSFTGANPPDTVGDVGTDYYIQMVNGGGTVVNIYNKTDGSFVQSFQLESLWQGGGFCASGLGDPVVLYDRLAGRWFLSEFSSSGNRICMYVSQTGDPTAGTWYGYEIAATSFPDYPKYAVWPDAYYISSNQTSSNAYAIDRTAMLNGAPATFVNFTVPDLAGFGFQALQAANVLGFQAPPALAPGIFMRHRDDEAHNVGANDPTEDYLELWEFAVDFATPGNSTFTGPFTIPIAEIDSELCGFFAFECFPQPGTTTGLDPLREVIMFPLIYRNFGSHETLVGNLVTDIDGADTGGKRWFELRKSGGGGWSLFQEGTYAPADGDSRFMGSIAMDNAGNIALGYNVSSTTTFPSLRYAGRLAGDPAGTLPQGEYSIVEGSASNASNRYGDYSAMSLDPVDDCTFWFTGMYNVASSWSTRIASFRFDACGEPGFSLSVNPSNPQVCAPGPIEPITLNIGSISDFTGDVTLSLNLPTGISGDVSPNPASAPGSAGISLTADGTAAPGNNVVDVLGTSPGADDRQTSIVVEVTTAVPGAPTLLTPADGETGTSLSPLLSWTDTGAEEYRVEVATDPGFNNIIDTVTVSGTSYEATGLDIETTYYWRVRGENICGDGDFSAGASFTTGLLLCSGAPLVLPDGDPAGVTQDLVLVTPGVIGDLDVSLLVTHTWVGDLIFRLENVDTGTAVTLMDRPGVPATTFGCSDNNINAIFDDSGDYAIEDTCIASPGPEGVAGFPIPEQSLAAFNGQPLAGTWRLFASDNAGFDLGQVDEWCLLPTFGGPDADGDGVPDGGDNCIAQANPDQADTNGDGIGNVCDPDINNDCIVDLNDLALFRQAFLTAEGDTNWNPDADLDNNLTVDLNDLALVRLLFLLEPGPAANPNPLSGCLAP